VRKEGVLAQEALRGKLVLVGGSGVDTELGMLLVWRDVGCAFLLSLESEEFLSVFLIEGMIVHLLASLRVDVEDLIVIIVVGFPWRWHWSFQAFDGNVEEFLVLFWIHSEELSIAMDFFLVRNVLALFTVIHSILATIIGVFLV